MENPECTLLSVVKVEEDLKEFKQEPVDDAELEFVQVEDALSLDEASFEQGTADDSRDALAMFSGDELVRSDCSLSSSKGDIGQRRRLRFSEADDMVLLRRVAALNPYKCSALWKDVTQMVAVRTGKNFSVRSIREHTDLLMNTYSLRGMEACLKRAPCDMREKKKQLLQKVLEIWKKDSHPAKSSTSSKRPGKELLADNHLEHLGERGDVEADNSNLDPISDFPIAKSSPSQPITSNEQMSAVSKTPSISLLIPQQNSPVKLHYSTPASSVTYPPLLASGLPPNIQQLALSARMGLQKLAVPSAFPFPGWGRPVLSKLVTAPPSRNSPLDPVADSILPDQPLPLVSKSSPAPPTSPVPVKVDQCTSPIPSLSGVPTINDAVAASDNPIASRTLPLDDSTELGNQATAAVSMRPERNSDCTVKKRGPRTSSILRARLHFLQVRHRDEYGLRVKELNLRKQRLALEARKLDLEERKVQLEEEKWKVEKKEREEKLLLIAEERQNKMALERRQQSMIDILLELKKKE
ncbi:hypothetical protein R5R35_004603 [Gryllus longicercus]|uniref:Uncharacterized protein n=1 Tax=Gryllus longicercus TaxID=2509291 RepID=A0AAN9WV21_9ORTH